MLRLQGILKAVINVALMTFSNHDRGQVFRCSHFHVGTKTPKNLACGMSLAPSHIGTESGGMQELPKDALVHILFLTGAEGRNTAERETHLTWPKALGHSNSCTWQPQLSTPGTSSLAVCPTGSSTLWELCSWWGCSALERTLHHVSYWENWIS